MDWIFQSNPKRFDVMAAISGDADRTFAMNQYRNLVSVGDRIFFWECGPKAKLVAVGHVTSPAYEGGSDFGEHLVDLEYDYQVEPPLTRNEILLSAAPLAGYRPFQWFMGTNFPIREPGVVVALQQAVTNRLAPLQHQTPHSRTERPMGAGASSRPRALTLKAPWAWAVVHGGKRIENRIWATSYRGPIYIHAGQKDTRADRDEVAAIMGSPIPERIAHGEIVATANLVDVVPLASVHRDKWAVGPYCWILEDVRPLARTLPMRGKLGLWTL
jgi:hypothetical protein